jgi:hypothetical protein
VSDESRAVEFELGGGGQFVFAEGSQFFPLLPAGESNVYTMTHFVPWVPAWDDLTFYPDGRPLGDDPDRRWINYERE